MKGLNTEIRAICFSNPSWENYSLAVKKEKFFCVVQK